MRSSLFTKAHKQKGLLTIRQARELALTPAEIRGLVRYGGWTPLLPGVLRAPGYALSWPQGLMALGLWGAGGLAISGLAAAGLLGMTGFGEGPYEVTTSRNPKALWLGPTFWAGIDFHRRAPETGCVTRHDGIPVMNRLYTLLCLGAVAGRDRVELALDDELVKGRVTLKGLDWVLGNYGGHGLRGTAVLRDLLRERAYDYVPPEGVLERDFLRLLRAAGLALPDQQVVVRHQGKFSGRVDFIYITLRLVIELDGYLTHASRERFQADRDRDNRALLEGLRVVRFTWYDVHRRPEYVVSYLRQVGVPQAA